MADPINVLGTAAVRSLLESIKLLSNLNKTPKRMKQQLSDVTKSIERMLVFRNTILASGSPVFFHLKPQQLKRIDEAVSEANLAMENLHQSLQLLFPQQTSDTNNTMKSLWRAVVSVTKEKDVQEKVQRINRIHQELMRDLLMTDLELHTSAWDLNSRIYSTVEASHRDAQARQDTWKTIGALLQHTADLTTVEVARLRDNTASIAASVDGLNANLASLSPSVAQIQEAAQTAISTQHGLEELRLHFNTSQRLLSADIDAKLLREREYNRAELPLLRDALLRMMTGNKANFSDYERLATAQISESTKRHLEIHTQRQLLYRPSTLRQMVDSHVRTMYRGPEPILHCHCRPSQTLISLRRGAFKLDYERCTQHSLNCPFYQSSVRSWLYTLNIRLTPFLKRTVGLTLGTTFGAGSWAIAPPLTFYATVERTQSPIFSEFDKFAEVCGRLRTSERREVKGHQRLHPYTDFEWDMAKVSQFLDTMIGRLSRSFRVGSANGSDLDESGCTMLHEILLLVTVLGPRCHSVAVQLQELLRLATLSGVDKFACSEAVSLEWEDTRGYILWTRYTNASSLTAMEILLGQILFVLSSSSQQVEIPVYDTIKLFDLEHTAVWDKIFDRGDFYLHVDFAGRSENPLNFFMKYPEYIEQLECGELADPILRRSFDGLQRAIVSSNGKRFLESKYGTFHPLKLAVGWPIGLKILLEEECFTMEAIELAICTNDIESLDTLLSNWSEHPVDWWSEEMLMDWIRTGVPSSYRMILESASSCNNNETHQCAVRYVKKALQSLNGLHFKLQKGEKIAPAASDQECSCCEVLSGESNKQANHLEPNDNISAYHFWDGWEGAAKLLDALYESGMTEIDLKSRHQETPLLYRVSRVRNSEPVPEAILWFLQKGANPSFDGPESWPNILFCLPVATEIGKLRSGRLKTTAAFYGSICDPLQTDDCQCHCSSSGCLPFRQILTCRMTTCYPKWHKIHCLSRTRLKFESLEDWAEIHGVEDWQMETICTESCRLEVFDRLGMAHTCCSIGISFGENTRGRNRGLTGECTDRIWRQKFPEAERELLRDEDEELREQLDLIMEAYKRMRETCSGSLEEYWEWWWQTLDDILPDLLPIERCKWRHEDFDPTLAPLKKKKLRQEASDERSRREREALRNSGYLGIEFTDVVRKHFRDYLS